MTVIDSSMPQILETILNNSDPGAAVILTHRLEETADPIIRTGLYAQASYYRLLNNAQELNVPLNQKEILKSAQLYQQGEKVRGIQIKAELFTKALFLLNEAIGKYLDGIKEVKRIEAEERARILYASCR